MEQVYKQQKIKITSISGTYKTIYQNGSYLLLFRKKNL